MFVLSQILHDLVRAHLDKLSWIEDIDFFSVGLMLYVLTAASVEEMD